MIESPALRRAIVAVLVSVTVVCLALVAYAYSRGAGAFDDPGARLDSLQDEDVVSATVKDREQLLSLSRKFATQFNTYDPSMLDDQGHLPEYASVSEQMTPKFADVFEQAIKIPEQTVAQGASSLATVYAVGVAAQDDDSAKVLVAGTIELSYLLPEEEGQEGEPGNESENPDGDGEDESLSTGPQRFRYELSLVKVDGQWLVDDVDDIDDGRPPFSQPAIPEEPSTSTPPTTTPPTTTPPTTTPPSESETSESGGEGEE